MAAVARASGDRARERSRGRGAVGEVNQASPDARRRQSLAKLHETAKGTGGEAGAVGDAAGGHAVHPSDDRRDCTPSERTNSRDARLPARDPGADSRRWILRVHRVQSLRPLHRDRNRIRERRVARSGAGGRASPRGQRKTPHPRAGPQRVDAVRRLHARTRAASRVRDPIPIRGRAPALPPIAAATRRDMRTRRGSAPSRLRSRIPLAPGRSSATLRGRRATTRTPSSRSRRETPPRPVPRPVRAPFRDRGPPLPCRSAPCRSCD